MLMSQNVNNDVSKDLPIATSFGVNDCLPSPFNEMMDIIVLFAVGLAFIIMSIKIYPIVREKFVDLIATNIREPKGVAGRIVRVSLAG